MLRSKQCLFVTIHCFQEENEGEITQGDRLNEIKARRMQQHHHGIPMPYATITPSFT